MMLVMVMIMVMAMVVVVRVVVVVVHTGNGLAMAGPLVHTGNGLAMAGPWPRPPVPSRPCSNHDKNNTTRCGRELNKSLRERYTGSR